MAHSPSRLSLAAFLTELSGQHDLVVHVAARGPGGAQRAHLLIDSTGSPPGNGTLFGLVFDPAHGVYFVDDGSNTLNLLH